MINALKKTDIDICNHLVNNAKMTMKVLGEKVFLSEDAVRKRVKRLEDNGFITGYQAILKATTIKPYVSGNNHIKLISNTGGCIERFMLKSLEIPQIINCQYVVAEGYDFIVIIEAASLFEHNQILSHQLCTGFDVHPVSTSFVLSETKGRSGGNFEAYMNKGIDKLMILIAYTVPFLFSEAMVITF
jgi:Lrp/AsnC family leucine-responsive transcriptional regulator